jgi:aspartate/glutamate racemase
MHAMRISQFKEVISELVARGAEGISLGCPEIPMWIKEGDCPVKSEPTEKLF